MNDFGMGRIRSLLLMLACGVILCSVTFLLGYISAIPGMIIGIVTGISYYLLLYQQIEKGGQMGAEQAMIYMKGGWVSRFCLVLSAVIISIKLHQQVLPMLIGFFTYRIVIFIDTVVLTLHEFGADEKAARQARLTGINHKMTQNRGG